jgi:DNA repair exonuclease SbcCD nuclease subunit
MIYLTGDTHGFIDIKKISQLKNISKDDYLIILGDVGICWFGYQNIKNNELLNWYKDNIPCKVLFIDGNHDNIDALNQYKTENWNGGNVHKITDQIYHLIRGQVYTIKNKKFFTMGGGNSVDKERRTRGVSWWENELPSDLELGEGLVNLESHSNKVDFILTHECPSRFLYDCIPMWAKLHFGDKPPNRLNKYLDKIYDNVEFDKWFFGHYHNDIIVNSKSRCLFDDIGMIII